jgi:hypothetical protein
MQHTKAIVLLLALLLLASSARAADPATDHVVDCKGVATQGWAAWNNLMPPPPDDFHLVGSVQVGNPGVTATLTPKAPQGIDPQILRIELSLHQQPGMWPQIVTWTQARFDKVPSSQRYTQVQIFCGSEKVQDVTVTDVR